MEPTEYAKGYYNGFSPIERRKRSNVVRPAMRRGEIRSPEQCHACGQVPAIGHSEDYGDLTYYDYWPVCYVCHKMLHERHRDPGIWNTYREMIREGWQAPVLEKFNWRLFNATYRTGHRAADRGKPTSEWPTFIQSSTWTPNMNLFDRVVDEYTGTVAAGLNHSIGDPVLHGMVIDPRRNI